jgi:hypothetical protein
VAEDALRDFACGPQPDGYADSSFGIDLPNGEYELSFSMLDRTEQPRDHGPMWIVAQGIAATEHFRVPAGQLVVKKLRATVVEGRLNFVVQSTSDGDWILNSLAVERVEPAIRHVPVRRADGSTALEIRATISGPDPIDSVRLVYGSDASGFEETPMQPAGRLTYRATIPRAEVAPGLAYFIEAADRAGRRAAMPRNGRDHPIRVVVTNDDEPPAVAHQKIVRWAAGKPLNISASVSDASGVKSVHLRYRGVNQHQDFRRLRMLPTGSGNEYRAEVPGADIDRRWDFMYYIEAIDRHGNGAIYPDLDRETPYVVVELER